MLERFNRLHWFLKFIISISTLILFIWIVVYIIPRSLPTFEVVNTSKWGIILSNERWSGDVKVVGDLWALPGTTVHIEPGTRITVSSSGDRSNLHYLPWGLKSGLNTGDDWFGVKNGELFWDEAQKIQIRLSRVVISGTKQQPVILTSDHPGSNPYDFNIISVNSGVIDNLIASNYRRFLLGNDVVVLNSTFKDTAECSLCAEYTSPTISGNIFEGGGRSYILVVGGSPRISDNLFNPGALVGVEIDPQIWSEMLLYNNDFEVDTTALRFNSGDEDRGSIVSSNRFSGNALIEIPCNFRSQLIFNDIRGRVRLAGLGNCVGSLTLGENFWGTDNPEVVLQEKIIGKERDFEVNILKVLNEEPMVGRRL